MDQPVRGDPWYKLRHALDAKPCLGLDGLGFGAKFRVYDSSWEAELCRPKYAHAETITNMLVKP